MNDDLGPRRQNLRLGATIDLVAALTTQGFLRTELLRAQLRLKLVEAARAGSRSILAWAEEDAARVRTSIAELESEIAEAEQRVIGAELLRDVSGAGQ
jgi:hypothetical protein